MNYGGMGFIIGHEITHGFDDEGRQFDLHGNLVDWWNNGTEQQFLERAKCIIEQYSNFTEVKTKLKVRKSIEIVGSKCIHFSLFIFVYYYLFIYQTIWFSFFDVHRSMVLTLKVKILPTMVA